MFVYLFIIYLCIRSHVISTFHAFYSFHHYNNINLFSVVLNIYNIIFLSFRCVYFLFIILYLVFNSLYLFSAFDISVLHSLVDRCCCCFCFYVYILNTFFIIFFFFGSKWIIMRAIANACVWWVRFLWKLDFEWHINDERNSVYMNFLLFWPPESKFIQIKMYFFFVLVK